MYSHRSGAQRAKNCRLDVARFYLSGPKTGMSKRDEMKVKCRAITPCVSSVDVSYLIRSKNSSTLNLACLRICASVDLLTGLCAGTVIFNNSSFVRFCKRMWLPRCRIIVQPPLWSALMIRLYDRLGTLLKAQPLGSKMPLRVPNHLPRVQGKAQSPGEY